MLVVLILWGIVVFIMAYKFDRLSKISIRNKEKYLFYSLVFFFNLMLFLICLVNYIS